MAERKPRAAIRDARLARPVRWLALALAGVVAGLMLGELVAGGRIDANDGAVGESSGYAGLSANPDAMVADAAAVPACTHCADSYGAAARLRARRAEQAAAGLPEPGVVDPEAMAPEPAADDYRYGGGFPDPERAAPPPSAPLPAPLPASPPAAAENVSSSDETPPD